MKKILSLILLVASTPLFATPYFSGETGAVAKFANTETSEFKPSLRFDAFIAGQISLNTKLLLRGEASLQTEDLYENGSTNETLSVFRVNEISATYTTSSYGTTKSLSFFKGNFENIGTQQFVQRRLGAQNYASSLTENYLGQNGVSAYQVYGYGGSASLTFKSIPISTGLVISRNDEKDDREYQINFDWRFATAFRYLTVDLLAGCGAPVTRKNSDGEDVYLLIETLYLHGGIDMLLGNRHSPIALYILGGFDDYPVKEKKDGSDKLKVEDVFALAELRFNLNGARIHITGYNVPSASLEKMLFINESFGLNYRFICDKLHTSKRNFSVGFDFTMGYEGKYVKDFFDKDLNDVLNVKISPFTEIDAMDGKLKIYGLINLTKISDKKPESAKLFIGYKKDL